MRDFTFTNQWKDHEILGIEWEYPQNGWDKPQKFTLLSIQTYAPLV